VASHAPDGTSFYFTGASLGGGAANLMANIAGSQYGGEFASAHFVAFASPNISTANGILNIGFENDPVYKAISGYNDFSSSLDNLVLATPQYMQGNYDGLHPPDGYAHNAALAFDAFARLETSVFFNQMSPDSVIIFDAFSGTVQDITPGRENVGVFYLGENMADVIVGRNGDDHIEGFAGDDTLIGGLGNDILAGGVGNDVYYVSDSGDQVQEGSGAGIDTVVASVNFTIPINVEVLYENGSGFIGTGSAGDDILVSLGGPNTLVGLGGNDVYYVTNSGDQVQEGSAAGIDTVVTSVNFTIPANVEVLYESGSGLIGTGSSGNDSLVSIGANTLIGSGGDDAFVFLKGLSNGTTVADFNGNGPDAGDTLVFVGYGTAAQGATLTQADAAHWSINSADGLTHDLITLVGATVHQSDFLFV
jgi:Ca2+-binding RTX toxin-like protein